MNQLDEEIMQWLARESLRKATEAIAEQLTEMANAPVLEGMTGKEVLLAAAAAIISNNEKNWGKEGIKS